MAKATRRADGRLVKTVVDPRTGKRKYFYGSTMRDINRQIMEYTETAERGRTFSEVADEWWDKIIDTLAMQSVNTYECAMRRAVDHFKDDPVKDITPKKIRAFLQIVAKKGYAMKNFISKEKRRFHILRNSWRTSISLSFHFDPLLCKCGHKMTLFQICLNGTPFFEKSNSWINSS